MTEKKITMKPATGQRGFKFFSAVGRFSVRFRWFVLVFWIAAVPIVTANFPNINDVSKNNNSDFLPKNSPSVTAADLESKFQSKDTAANAIILASRAHGKLSDADDAAIKKVEALLKNLKALAKLKTKESRPTAKHGKYL
jgi:RND superfamily putative drug exporter